MIEKQALDSNSDAAEKADAQHPSSLPELGRRLLALFDAVGTRLKAAEIAGRSTDQLAKWAKGQAEPPFAALAKLCREAGISMEWLAFDQGPMRIADRGGLRIADGAAFTSGSQTAEVDPVTLGDAIAAVRAVEAALNVDLTAKATGKVVMLACDHIKAGETAAQLVAAITQAVRGAVNESRKQGV